MYCQECGNEFKDKVKFCPECGAKMVEESQSITSIVDDVMAVQSGSQDEGAVKKYSFLYSRDFGQMTVKYVKSDVEITGDELSVSQQPSKLIILKGKVKKNKAKIEDIQSIRVKGKMDVADTLFGIIFLVMGFIYPLGFLMSIVLFWSAYNKRIQVDTDRGRIEIPVKGNKRQIDEFIEDMKERNDRIILT